MRRIEDRDTNMARRYRYLICLIIFLSYILVYFHRLCPAVIALDMQKSFEVSGTLLGVLSSAYFYPYAIMQLPTGLLADSWGPRKTVFSFLVVAAAGSIVMGLAPNLGIAIIGRVLVGFGVSTLFVCNFKLLSRWFDPQEFVIMGGIFITMGGIGALFSSAPLAWMSNQIGWRMSLVIVGVISFLMAVLVLVFVYNRPAEKGWPDRGLSENEKHGPSMSLLQGMRYVFMATRFWPLSVWCFSGTGLFFALGGLWGGPYLTHVYGLSIQAIGGVLSMGAVAIIIGSPTLGLISNHLGRKPIFIGCSLLLLTVCCIFHLSRGGLPLYMLHILFFCLGLSGGAIGPLQATVSKELFPIDIAGTALGVVNIFPFLGGAFFQVIIGVIVTHGVRFGKYYLLAGYQDIFLFCAAGASVSLLSAILLHETLTSAEAIKA